MNLYHSALPRVYIASKIDHAEKWIALWKTWPKVHIVSRWPFMIGRVDGTGSEAGEFAKKFWQSDEADVRSADYCIVYAEPGDKLRGALVEAGIAIASGVHVIVVGEHPDYSTWQWHPAVQRADDLDHAYQLITAE